MSTATLRAHAYCQTWNDNDLYWHRAAPAVGSSVLLPAEGFPRAVNRHLAAAPTHDVVILSDGFGLVGPRDLDMLVRTASRDHAVIRAYGDGAGTDAAFLAAPGDLLGALGLNAELSTWYWADELERATLSYHLAITWLEYDETARADEMRARYFAAVADLGVLESYQRSGL